MLFLFLGVVAEPSWADLAQLGTYALAMMVGYGACFKLQVVHERRQTERAEQRAEQERARTQESEARERKQAEAALPALQEANRALVEVTRMIERQTRP